MYSTAPGLSYRKEEHYSEETASTEMISVDEGVIEAAIKHSRYVKR